jgi:hypothetical protein
VTRLTWMQFRLQAFAAAAALAVVAIVLAVTGASLHHLYSASVLDCRSGCSALALSFAQHDHGLQLTVNVLVELVPALAGIFWGAPLVAREFETGTYRLAWTQTTPARWIAIKLAAVGLASVAVAGLVSLIVTWWSSPLDATSMSLYTSFDQRDLAPLGYAAFAFAAGVAAGLLIRRTVPAMAATPVVFIPARLAFARWVRPRLLPSQQVSVPDVLVWPVPLGRPVPGGSVAPEVSAGAAPPDPADWVLSDRTVNASGHVIGSSGLIGSGNGLVTATKNHGVVLGGGYSCPNLRPSARPAGQQQFASLVRECVNQLHIREVLTYQPVSHYWALQWCEFGCFLAAALLLAGCCLWWVRRRIG